MKSYETIIIGGGISGLACGRTLHDAGKDFLIITKELGGRMLSYECFCINYGAAYITTDYKNVLKYVGKIEPLRVRDFYFFDGKNMSNIFTFKIIKRIPKMIKFILILIHFRWHWLRYRKQAPYRSIKECFETDPVLMKYWKMPASDFIKKHGFEELDELYGNPVTAATAFVESDKVNTVYYLGMFFAAIIKSWIIHFKDTITKLTEGFEEKIKIGSVLKVNKNDDGTFHVTSSIGEFTAKNIVFAAPQKTLATVYDLPEPNRQQPAYAFHVLGIRKDIYQNKKAICFRPEHHDVYMLWTQKSGADIIYSRNPEPDFNQYYEEYRVIKRIHWDPGMIIPKDELIEQKLEEHVYLASDYNLSLLEDCFLTGVFAANQIIGKHA